MPIAILFGLVVMAILLPTLLTATQQNSTVILGTVASQQLKQLTSAAQQYIQANFAAVLGASSTTTPATITVPMLIATGFLPQGFQALNPYGQTWQVEALQAPAGQIQALVMSTGGTPVPTRDAARITAQAGAEGGIVGGGAGNLASPTCTVGQACGAFGGWKVATSGYTGLGPGSLLGLLAFNSAGQLNQQYLYRVAVPGQPQLNAMQTDLSMTDQGGTPHNITGAGNVQAQTAQLAAGWVNGQPGALQIGSNYYYGDATNAAVRTPGGLYIQNQNGSGAADISEVNNVWSSGELQGGYVNSTGNVNAQNALTAGGGFTAQSNGYTTVADTLTVGARVALGTAFGSANQGWGCGPNGEIASNANGSGQLMSCVNGTWQPSGGGITSTYYALWQNWTRDSGWIYNASGHVEFITAQGGAQNGTCGNNDWQLSGWIDGTQIISVANNNQASAKNGSIYFFVNPGSSWRVTSNPYNCWGGLFSASALVLQ